MGALIFPGQGSQYVGMGKSLAAASPVCRAVFDEVDDAVNFRLSELMFDGDAETLRLTENAQPALLAVSVALVRLWCERAEATDISILCSAIAGHSLGEYSALTAAGAIALDDAAGVVKARGAAMQQAVPVGAGGMVAVLGLDSAEVQALADEIAREAGTCVLANDNAPGQVVLSGTASAMEWVVAQAKSYGAKRALTLPVSAPFHSPMMAPAREAMIEHLEKLAISAPVVACYANVDTMPTRDVEQIRQNLIEQICAPVRWRELILRMSGDDVTTFIEVGAGKVLSGLGRRIVPDAESIAIGEADDLAAVLSVKNCLRSDKEQ